MVSLSYMIVLAVLIFLFIVGIFFEYSMYTSAQAWKRRRKYAALLLSVRSTMLVASVLAWPIPFAIFLSTGLLYNSINTMRVYASRIQPMHLQSISKRSFIWFGCLQAVLITLIAVYIVFSLEVAWELYITFFAMAAFIVAISITIAMISNIIGSKPKKAPILRDSELPTVTVAIAARNETPMLTACLESVIASDYPKLEVLVLDDDSQDTTAEIIKSFAHDGVRFVTFDSPNGEWLAKNKAYETLLQQAAGDIVLFMGVDVRLHVQSVRRIAEQMTMRNVAMMTVLPKRTKSGAVAAFIQPIRYWWELAMPRAYLHRPPALSTCWVVRSRQIKEIGGFKTYKRSITPEEHLAKFFHSIGAYAFVRPTRDMLVTTHKDFGSQWDTQVRTRYPHAHRRPENAFIQTFALLLFVVLPFGLVLLYPLGYAPNLLQSVSIIGAVILYSVTHFIISIVTNPIAGFLAPFNFPVAVALDVVALHVSMIKYEFFKVVWKGRDIAPKKLKVIPRLPSVE